ncbi:MAG: sensor histidine kinase, partial [Cellulosimicrobium cellulans]
MPLPSPAPPAHGVADDVALTTPDVRRRGSVGRLVEEHPRAADAALAVGVVTLGLVTAVLGLATVEGSTSLGLFRPDEPVAQVVVAAWLTGAALGAALLLGRRARPLVV